MTELWKQVKGYEKLYEASSLGRIRTIKRKVLAKAGALRMVQAKIRKQYKNKKGYRTVQIWKNGKASTKTVHRMVLEAFIPNTENKPHVNHINSNREDNRLENLEWVTIEENYAHSRKNGKMYMRNQYMKVKRKVN